VIWGGGLKIGADSRSLNSPTIMCLKIAKTTSEFVLSWFSDFTIFYRVVVVRDLEVILSNMWQIGKPVPLPEEAPYLGVSRPAMNVQ
jgi:hypothetical protein